MTPASSQRQLAVILLVLGLIGAASYPMFIHFGKRESATAASSFKDLARLRVTGSRPHAGQTDVLPNSFISCDLNLPHTGHGVDAATLTPQTVRLTRADDDSEVPVRLNTSGAGDAIVCTPNEMLQPRTTYVFEVRGVRDTSGAEFEPYRLVFTTSDGVVLDAFPARFERVELPTTELESAYTALTFGPDGLLYAGTFDGRILRFAVKEDGTLSNPTTIPTVLAHNGGPRMITGLTFDPGSTSTDLKLWVNHGQMAIHEGRVENADDWTGKLSVLDGPDLSAYRDVLVHLPRAYKDHLNFQMAFGPDGALYFCQGSHTSTGAPDRKWAFRPERLLTAAVLRVDVRRIQSPLSVKTELGGSYDPFAPGAPVTIHATGVRSGFDILWHSNGKLYVGLNGAAAGGATPASDRKSSGPRVPGIERVEETTNDWLLQVEPGMYYGHPNPTRGEYVLNGGNPTAGVDPWEVRQYPVGVLPAQNFRAPVYDFGKSASPVGMIEYRSGKFGGILDGAIFVTRYSGGKDIMVLRPRSDGSIAESLTGIDGLTGFNDPLDLAQHPSGSLYVAEYGGRRLSLLRPVSGESRSVFRQTLPELRK